MIALVILVVWLLVAAALAALLRRAARGDVPPMPRWRYLLVLAWPALVAVAFVVTLWLVFSGALEDP